jgi:hypothetical protein
VPRSGRTVLASGVAAAAILAGATVVLLRGGGEGAAALPSCARVARTIARPRDLPRSFRLPPGTVFTKRYRNVTTRGVPQIEGRMPLGLVEATRFLDDELPRAGFKLMLRQRRRGRAYSALYETRGFGGHFTVLTLPACGGATAFSVSARPTLLGRSHAE